MCYLVGNAQVVESDVAKVKFHVDTIDDYVLLLKEHEEWSAPFIVERKSFDLADDFAQLFVRGRERELLEMFRRLSKGVVVKLDTGSSKVERFIVADKTFVLQGDVFVCDGVEITITDRPLYEIFEKVNKMLSIPTK